jgi:hypothetical protein
MYSEAIFIVCYDETKELYTAFIGHVSYATSLHWRRRRRRRRRIRFVVI